MTDGFELVLVASLSPRSDRPRRIGFTIDERLAVRRSAAACVPAIVNGTPQPTLWLNNDELTQYPQLLSRFHAELVWDASAQQWVLHDGNPREAKASTNGTAVDGVLVPLRKSAPVPEGAQLNFGTPHLLPEIPGRKRSNKKPREFLYTLRLVSAATSSPPAASAKPSRADEQRAQALGVQTATMAAAPPPASHRQGKRPVPETGASAASGRTSKRARIPPVLPTPPQPSPAEQMGLRAAAVRHLTGAAADLDSAMMTCTTSLTPGAEVLVMGPLGGEAALSRSLEVLVSSLLSASGPASAGLVSLLDESQEEVEVAGGGSEGPSVGRSTPAQRLLQLHLARFGFGVPASIVLRTLGAVVLPSRGHDESWLHSALSAAGALRGHAVAVATARRAQRAGSVPPHAGGCTAGNPLLEAVLCATAATIRCAYSPSPAPLSRPGLADEPPAEVDSCERAVTMLTVLCSLLSRAPSLEADSSTCIVPTAPAGGRGALLIFDACAATSTGLDAGAARHLSLEHAACELAARVLARMPHEAAMSMLETRSAETATAAASRGGGPSGDAGDRIAALELYARDAMLSAFGALAATDEGARRLLDSTLRFSLRGFSLTAAPTPHPNMPPPIATCLRVLSARPGRGAMLEAKAWAELAMLVKHALCSVLRNGLDESSRRDVREQIGGLQAVPEPGASHLALALHLGGLLFKF